MGRAGEHRRLRLRPGPLPVLHVPGDGAGPVPLAPAHQQGRVEGEVFLGVEALSDSPPAPEKLPPGELVEHAAYRRPPLLCRRAGHGHGAFETPPRPHPQQGGGGPQARPLPAAIAVQQNRGSSGHQVSGAAAELPGVLLDDIAAHGQPHQHRGAAALLYQHGPEVLGGLGDGEVGTGPGVPVAPYVEIEHRPPLQGSELGRPHGAVQPVAVEEHHLRPRPLPAVVGDPAAVRADGSCLPVSHGGSLCFPSRSRESRTWPPRSRTGPGRRSGPRRRVR